MTASQCSRTAFWIAKEFWRGIIGHLLPVHRRGSSDTVAVSEVNVHEQVTAFVASCISLVTTSMVFAIRGDIEPAMSGAFQLTSQQMGLIWSPAFWAFTIAIFVSGALVDVVGMRALHILSAVGYVVGVAMVLLAPYPTAPVASIFDTTGTTLLYAGFFTMGLSQGLVEGVINPLVATLYSAEKTRKLNMLHAWWPAGMIIGGLLAYAFTNFGASWQIKLSLI